MSRRAKPTIDDDLRDAVEDDERAALVAELRRDGFVGDAEEWLGCRGWYEADMSA